MQPLSPTYFEFDRMLVPFASLPVTSLIVVFLIVHKDDLSKDQLKGESFPGMGEILLD